MIKHIVCWKIKPQATKEAKEQIMMQMKTMLEGLWGKIPGLLTAEVGIDQNRGAAAYDICLVCTFPDWDSLARYQDHPLHVRCKEYIASVAQDRCVCDYERA